MSPPIELVKTILPGRFSFTNFRTNPWVSSNGAKKLVSNERRSSSRGISLIGPLMPMAALLTRMTEQLRRDERRRNRGAVHADKGPAGALGTLVDRAGDEF